MTEHVLWSELKHGQWVYHTDFVTGEYLPWRVSRVEKDTNLLVLAREQLNIKKYKMQKGAYQPGNANCTAIIAPVEAGRTFELAPAQPDQFEWTQDEGGDR